MTTSTNNYTTIISVVSIFLSVDTRDSGVIVQVHSVSAILCIVTVFPSGNHSFIRDFIHRLTFSPSINITILCFCEYSLFLI